MTAFTSAKQARFAHWATALFLISGLVLGCGDTKTGTVSGNVKYKGVPVTGGYIKFHPTGGGAPLTGAINPDGTFSLTGVAFGASTVTIDTESLNKSGSNDYTKKVKPPPGVAPPPEMHNNPGPPGVYVEIPKKYSDPKTSGLSWEIKSGSQSKDFELD